MPPPTTITRNGHRTFLKWHRARRRPSDPVFTGRRIAEGMRAGASVEVDLVVHADAGFAVLHEPVLGIETTGSGRVRDTPAAVLRTLRLRDNAGNPTEEPVMLLEDLAALVAREGAHPDALLQLDYKEDAAALAPVAGVTFAQALAPVARHFILSSGDAASVRLLSTGLPALRIGYDPCHEGALERVSASRAWPAFVAEAVAASPAAELVYLAHELVLAAAADGYDFVAAFHRADRRVDAYTIYRADTAGLAAAHRLLELRVDQITTDDPDGLAIALGQPPLSG
ncbi:MAG: glycerophosphodiester phosphodiesterase family protein [Amaricoccus sp.]